MKMMNETKIYIKRYAHGEGDFWCKMGPFFASAEVRRALGRPLTSSPAYTWWLAMDGEAVAGFGAVKAGRQTAELCHAYVLHDYRRQGVYSALIAERVEWCQQFDVVKTVATAASRPILEKFGFQVVGYRGRYAVMNLRSK